MKFNVRNCASETNLFVIFAYELRLGKSLCLIRATSNQKQSLSIQLNGGSFCSYTHIMYSKLYM